MFGTCEELLTRILAKHQVQGILILERGGDNIIHTTFNYETSTSYAKSIKSMLLSAETLTNSTGSNNALHFIRIKTQTNEFMIVPGSDYFLVVIVSN
ncbi:hypothetical protein T552_00372 [Pneumocystis carinii B80]|uniref:Roadblock/LAMTOR2 domain-containing protein n=1 Tax=Pneumocystis carinii (strain B80) TaxID=1408658 RepID=A0A0W4ZQL7_PNEC8|nr:hypothetical protein T552_00372 [Pneumocystis carinii B80]KTW30657.1 hypothetical protein T552_00372 [Pneumocystis carinii B80]